MCGVFHNLQEHAAEASQRGEPSEDSDEAISEDGEDDVARHIFCWWRTHAAQHL